MTSHRTRRWRIASLLSVGVHGLLVLGLAQCPAYHESAREVASTAPPAQRPAPPRLTFVTLVPSASAKAARASTQATSPLPPREAQGDIPRSARAVDGPIDTAASAQESTLPTRVDSAPPSAVEYERPLHPALRGLVPEYNGGKMWRMTVSGSARVPTLAPRPAECTLGKLGYVNCVRRLRRWRDDSIYHVAVRCARDSLDIARVLPPDCAYFRPDSSSH